MNSSIRSFMAVLAVVPLAVAPASARPQNAVVARYPDSVAPLTASVTHHRGVFKDEAISYRTEVEGLEIRTAPGEAARIVSFSYIREDVASAARPVLFLFNGGPIAASQYLHIGGIGPKRISYPGDLGADPRKFQLIDNAYSPLDAVDLVFVDPASTGFSRVLPGTDPKAYFSVAADGRQFAAFIRTWLKSHRRESSPVYLFGESYGTNRAAEIAGQLSAGPDPLPLSGVFLYGQAVNIVEYAQRPANLTSYVASLPTLAAIGWYHRKADDRGRSLETILAEARGFAKGDYLRVLYAGNTASEADRRLVAARLAGFTGIDADWYLANDLRITKEAYRRTLLADRGLLLGQADARYSAAWDGRIDAGDPSAVVSGAVERLFPSYLASDLKLHWKLPYVGSVSAGFEGWDWGPGSAAGPFGDWPYYKGLSVAMERNPDFRLVIANGIYDTQTTMGAAELLATQPGWSPTQVSLRYYDGGHMGYSVAGTARAIGEDIRTMVGAGGHLP